MDTKDKIINAQKEILDKLAICEEAIATLYATYSRTIPEMNDFWLDLSKKETAHARLLKTMHKQLDAGNIFQNIGRFSLASLNDFLTKITAANNLAENNKVTSLHAIETALSIETSVLDAHFYDIVKSDSAEFKVIADRLSSDTHDHAKSVQEKLIEIQSSSSANE